VAASSSFDERAQRPALAEPTTMVNTDALPRASEGFTTRGRRLTPAQIKVRRPDLLVAGSRDNSSATAGDQDRIAPGLDDLLGELIREYAQVASYR
jgi:hypothetical protein